jgi:hypothetical protein
MNLLYTDFGCCQRLNMTSSYNCLFANLIKKAGI